MVQAALERDIAFQFKAIGDVDDSSFFEEVLAAARQWLAEIIDLPPRDVVIKATRQALQDVFAGIDSPGPDALTEPAAIEAILIAVGYIYDSLVRPTV